MIVLDKCKELKMIIENLNIMNIYLLIFIERNINL